MMDAQTASVRLALTGDVMLGRLVDEAIARYGPAYPWGDLAADLRAADLTWINLECVISNVGTPWRRTPKVFHFHARPHALETLAIAGVDGVALANNHTLDWEVEALLEMLPLLDARGIAHAGAGADLAAAAQPALLEARGLRIAAISWTDNMPEWAAAATTPGVFYVPVRTSGPAFEHLCGLIRAAREQAAVVLVSAHWGPNMRRVPPPHFRAFARALIDAGATLFHGHSAHLFQGIEVYRGCPILYDAGDFVDDYAVDPVERNDQSFLFIATLQGDRVARLDLLPVRIDHCQVNHAVAGEAAQICERMRALSAALGTELQTTSDGLALAIAPG
jgi:poly-gamma-glutamate synthesis protein (capsule biosynthesis protein)